MDNSKYLNKNITKVISSLELKSGKSKEGSDYLYLDLAFINGYSKRIFLNNESMFAIRNAIDNLAQKSGNDEQDLPLF